MRALSRFVLTCLLTCAAAASVHALTPPPPPDPVGVRGDFSGTWFNPAQSGHGIFVEVLDGGRAAVAWFTFDPDGAPIWLYGVLAVDGASLRGELSSVSGGRFPPGFDPTRVSSTRWGTIELQADGCDNAELRWTADDPAYGSGSMPMQRLTAIAGQRCNAEEEFAEQRSFHFEQGLLGFQAVFADLPTTGQDIYELDYGYVQLPAPLEARRGLRLTGHNRSDDLAMWVVAPIDGLRPNTPYRVELELELASDVPTGCFGIGGSPGDSVYLKLGASTVQPQALPVNEGGFTNLRMNVDIGNQAEGGEAARVVGTLANSQSCDDGPDGVLELKTVSTGAQPLSVTTDANGRLWVMAGTDSAFEGLTVVHFTALRVRLQPLTAAAAAGAPMR